MQDSFPEITTPWRGVKAPLRFSVCVKKRGARDFAAILPSPNSVKIMIAVGVASVATATWFTCYQLCVTLNCCFRTNPLSSVLVSDRHHLYWFCYPKESVARQMMLIWSPKNVVWFKLIKYWGYPSMWYRWKVLVTLRWGKLMSWGIF